MNFPSSWRLGCAAFLLLSSAVFAANPVPRMEVVARQGSTILYRGFTNDRGRFSTGPLQPGIYTIDVLTVPNTPPTSARYFLSLSGAKPVGEATLRPGIAVSMDASVRRPTSIKGQVTARGGVVYVRPREAVEASTPAAPTPPRLNPFAVPTPSPAAGLRGSAPNTAARPTPVPPRMAPQAKPLSAYPPRVINGKTYYWVPVSPGSNMGRWLTEEAARAAASGLSRPAAKPSPTPTRRQR